MVRPSLVVFDLDGTLADSQEGVLHSFALTLAEDGRRESVTNLRNLIGPPLSESFERLGYDDEAIDDAVVRYRVHYDRDGVDMSRLYDGAMAMLDGLRALGIELRVATSKRVDFARRMLRNLAVDSYFSVVCGAALDGTLNTKREVLDEALRFAPSHSPIRSWMVGDRREDMRAALDLAVVPVGALWGYGSPDELRESGALLAMPSCSAVLEHLHATK